MTSMLDFLNIKMNGTHHVAINDVKNLFLIVKKLHS